MSSAAVLRMQDALLQSHQLANTFDNAIKAQTLQSVVKSGKSVVDAHKKLGRITMIAAFASAFFSLVSASYPQGNTQSFWNGMSTASGKIGDIASMYQRGDITQAEQTYQKLFQVDFREHNDRIQSMERRLNEMLGRVPALLQLIHHSGR